MAGKFEQRTSLPALADIQWAVQWILASAIPGAGQWTMGLSPPEPTRRKNDCMSDLKEKYPENDYKDYGAVIN